MLLISPAFMLLVRHFVLSACMPQDCLLADAFAVLHLALLSVVA